MGSVTIRVINFFEANMRILIFFLFLTLPATVNALTIEVMYKHCKPFAENGFQAMPKMPGSGGICSAYFAAVRDQAGINCVTFKILEDEGHAVSAAIKTFYSGNVPSTNALIQEFINSAEESPGVWDNHVPLLTSSILGKYSC